MFLIGTKFGKTRIFPISTKLIFIFIIFILASNFTSHYISLLLNRTQMVKMLKQVLIKDLKELYTFCTTQFEIYKYNKELEPILKGIEKKALNDFKNEKSIFAGIKPDGTYLFEVSKLPKNKEFPDKEVFSNIIKSDKQDVKEGLVEFQYNNVNYLGVYKYNPGWDAYLIRGEELNEFYSESQKIFEFIAIIIGAITLFSAIIGVILFNYILRFMKVITRSILKMNETQSMEMIELKKAPNDDITFLGYAFNTLSNTINNLMGIFRKFTNRDIVIKAYKEKEIKLEGSRRELTCLFSDIKGFTYMTEVLGTDIIKLLNLHYQKAIHEIIQHDGIIGSIIGDALLAVYGAFENTGHNKSLQAINSAYKIQEVAEHLRKVMIEKRGKIERERGRLDETEEKVYKAVLIEVGVGIDGGLVFYGNIGSDERMTNTVIGDNVNSASRLEGLTRIYHVPVICSEFVKQDILTNAQNHGLEFVEIDLVQVKGKTIGKKIFWPLQRKMIDGQMDKELSLFAKGLEIYFDGDWQKAYTYFAKCRLPLGEVFAERTKDNKCPKGWNGIWAMKEK